LEDSFNAGNGECSTESSTNSGDLASRNDEWINGTKAGQSSFLIGSRFNTGWNVSLPMIPKKVAITLSEEI
jgi:hypothetical protein